MKIVKLLGIAAVAMMLCLPVMGQDDEYSIGKEVDLPCTREAFDNAEYFRALGVGRAKGNNTARARLAALTQAKQQIYQKLSSFVQGSEESYFNLIGSDSEDEVEQKIESGAKTVFQKMLNDVETICEKMVVNKRGQKEVYMAIQVSKAEIKKEIIDDLEKRMGTDFRADQFLNAMDGKMEELLDAKSNAGY